MAGYLLVLRNSVASSAVRAMAGALDRAERGRMFSAAAVLYAAVGLVTGVLIAAAALAIGALILSGELGRQAQAGGAGLGLVTGLGIASTVNLDALRAERLFVRSALTEIVAVSLHLGLMLGLIFGGADLAWVIAFSGAIPLFSGLLCAVVASRSGLPVRFEASAVTRERTMEIVPTAGWLLVVELSNLAMYAFSRIILGAYRSPTAVGQFEGPVRAHNLLYALGGALAVPVVPTASRYVAAGDSRRLRELVLRGTRYTLALFVPLCVTLMVLAEPILDVWLGDRYGEGAAALAILVSYWLLYGGLVVTPGFLVGAGRARDVGLVMVGAAVLNLALSLRADARARDRGAGPRNGDPVLPGFSAAAAGGAGGVCGVARRGRALGLAAGVHARRGACRGARGHPARAGALDAAGRARHRRRRGVGLLGGVLRARPDHERAGARAQLGQSLSSERSGASRSRSEVWSSIPSGHLMPTSGSSKRKPDSAAGS